MITQGVKKYIEQNIDLLETDKRKFLAKALTRMLSEEFEELITCLEQSNIPLEPDRSLLIINKLGFIFPVVEDGTPLQDVVDEKLIGRYVKTFFGMSTKQIVDFIIDNQDEWKYDMELYDNDGVVCVRVF